MRNRLTPRVRIIVFLLAGFVLRGAAAWAQVTPAAGYTPPDDTPAIKVGATIFTDYTYQTSPDVKDADGNSVDLNQFNVSRAYINVTGNISHIIAFRITPDVVRQSGLLSLATGNTVSNDSLVFRLKYAYAQFNLDDWMTHGSWVRLGIQQTPYVDFIEGIYRYRFQGTIFAEREGFLTSSDAGASFHTNFAKNYGDFHVGIYNGDGYAKVEPNSQKAFQVRGTVRPVPMGAVLRGLRVTVFYDNDRYVKSDDRNRFIVSPTFEHKYVNAGFEYLNTEDRPLATAAKLDGEGYSFWITPKSTKGCEGLFRYDHEKPDKDASPVRERTIAGVAYRFPHQGTVSTALLLDYEKVDSKHFTPSVPKQQRIALHGLVNF